MAQAARRLARTLLNATLLALAVCLLLAPGAEAATLNDKPYRQWVHALRVPLPANVTIHETDCFGTPEACATPPSEIYFPGGDRDTFLHELGHLYDFQTMRGVDRYRFAIVARRLRPWGAGEHDDQLGEWFASGYAMCATRGFSLRDTVATWYTGLLMNWHPTGNQLARTCRLIRAAAVSRTRPRPTASGSSL